jgi:hypothetical protein
MSVAALQNVYFVDVGSSSENSSVAVRSRVPNGGVCDENIQSDPEPGSNIAFKTSLADT